MGEGEAAAQSLRRRARASSADSARALLRAFDLAGG